MTLDGFPPWLVAAKSLPPRNHVSIIERPELIRRLNAGLSNKLTLMVASAGFGKSTLLSSWRKKLLEQNTLVAWLNIDQDDNDPSLFAICLAYSLASAGLANDISKLHPAAFTLDTPFQTTIGILISAIAAYQKQVVVVIDEGEKLEDVTARKILDPLLRYAPENLHTVLSSRTTDHLQFSALKIQGQVDQITTQELQFTALEVDTFFSGKLDKKQLQTVNKKTNRWPVALQLIKNALAGQKNHTKIIEKFHGTRQDTREYILEQVLYPLPEPQKGLLLDMSILEQFDPETADLVRETTDSAHVLKETENLSGLVFQLEGKETLYRFHPLFRETLKYYLEQSRPKRKKELHLKAADLLFDQGHIIQSIRQALAAGEPESAASILERSGGLLLWNREGMTRIRKAHDLLPEHTVATHPRLSLLRALVLMKDGLINDARDIYHSVEQKLKDSHEQQSAELEYELAVIASTLAVYEGTSVTEEMSGNLAMSLERLEQIDRLQVGFVYTVLCVFHLQKGDFPAAKDVGNKAISHFQTHRSIFGETYIHVHLGVVAFAEGYLDRAFEHYTKAQGNLRRYFIEDKDLKLVVNIVLSEWHYEKNELSTAARLLGDINRRLETGEAWYETYAAGYSTYTSITYLQKGLGPCLQASDDAVVYIRREGLKRLNRLVVANKVGYLCRAGKIAEARNIVQENNLTVDDYKKDSATSASVRESYGVIQALARLLIAEERYSEAIAELRKQINEHKPAYEVRTIKKYRLLLAIALYNNDEPAIALQELEKVLSFARNQGFLRLILDEDPFINEILEAYVLSENIQEKDHAQYLLNLLYAAKSPQTDIVLSRREKEVLGQLTEGYSDKIIARNLSITENTVRFHLKNLFTKLDVNSRLKVVSEAHKHKLF